MRDMIMVVLVWWYWYDVWYLFWVNLLYFVYVFFLHI